PSSIHNKNGVEIKGVLGFLGALKKINNALKATSIAIVFDSETSTSNNLTILEDYKSNRPDFNNVPDDENPFIGLPIIKKSLIFLDIPFYEVESEEADDYIASIATKYRCLFDEIIIVSNDSDFFQLIDEKIFIYSARGKLSKLYDESLFQEKYHLKPNQYIEYKSLIGDTADNIRGVKGIGKKTAEGILTLNSIDNYLKESSNERIKELLKNNYDIIKRNKKLITLNRHLDTSSINIRDLNDKINKYNVYAILSCINEN
ncbi:MAG: hypothetical protein K2I70_05215, partial [Bacilli bacterium]|nr:hypothetical protein [Bacilli bacterium]